MCGRYTLHKKADDIAKRYNLASKPADVRDNFSVAPTQTMPVITEDDKGRLAAEPMRWGIPRTFQAGTHSLFNTRADKAFGGFWRRTTMQHRCLIPADGYFEWKKMTQDGRLVRVPYYFKPKQLELFSFAGIWDEWVDDRGRRQKVYSILTTDPNREAAAVHDRMPVILYPDEERPWLEADSPEALSALLHPFEDGGLECYEVSRDINAGRTNDGHLIVPVNSR
jgi:putative SOS response-associated peptidase YedK